MKPALTDLRLFVTLLLVSVFIFLLDSLNIFALPKAGVQFLISPIQLGTYSLGRSVSSQGQFLWAARRASQENVAIKEQLGSVLVENSQLRIKITELQAMTDQSQALNPQTFHTSPARVIGLNRYLAINKGSDDGLKVGQAVVYKDGFVGTIKELSPKKALIMVSSDPDSKISAIGSNQQGKAQGILIGQFGNQLLLDKVLHEEPLAPGDLIYTSGTEGKLPKGLVLGLVSEVMDKDNEVFKQAKISPIFEPDNLDLVFILTDE
jgi:rod shape-determining protein MreC